MSTTIALKDVLAFIGTASLDDRNAIAEELRYRRSELEAEAKQQFRVGDQVEFNPRKRGYPETVKGVVFSKNPKTIEVKPSGGGRHWRVSPTILRKAAVAEPKPG